MRRRSAGKKLYVVRDAQGAFLDIQACERAHAADRSPRSQAEQAPRRRASA
jgi:hypothetical protein